MPGTLYLVASPIGNLEDFTFRAVRILNQCDLIACEDTRHTAKLLNHYGIAKPLISYHDHNESGRAPELIAKLRSGLDVALISDAGMPLVADPGYRLVTAAVAEGISVQPIPGASALVAALAASGLPTDAFRFEDSCPLSRDSGRRSSKRCAASRRRPFFSRPPTASWTHWPMSIASWARGPW
jgi:probable S-adenosylmethionine-dependent methyltransferase, YraL family